MKHWLLNISVALCFALPALADGPSRPGPNHPKPVKPNPIKPIPNPVHPKPSQPVPVKLPHQQTPPGKIGGVHFDKPVLKKLPDHTVKVNAPSHRLNPWVQNNFKGAKGKLDEAKKHKPDSFKKVNEWKGEYKKDYAKHWDDDGKRFRKYYDDDRYRYSCSKWYGHGFYGGYFYPARPCLDITIYFEYPVVDWFYAGEVDDDYYTACYGEDYKTYPVEVFPYASVYYPTETLQDLGVDVSGLSAAKQDAFRYGVVFVTDQLRKMISDRLGADYQFGEGEIVLTHYENLKNEVYVLEGFVDGGNVHVSFKALVDLEDSSLSAVYAAFENDPSTQDLEVLTWINNRMIQFGGDPYTAILEPVQQ